jgi:hypothetical protein
MNTKLNKTEDAPMTTKTEDFAIDLGSFAGRSHIIRPVTAAGFELFAELFGQGARFAEIPKSRVQEFTEYVELKGLSWYWHT